MPVLNAEDNIETAWARSCEYLEGPIRLDMLFQPGQGFPTWASLTDKPPLKPQFMFERPWAVLAHTHDECYCGPWGFLGGRIRTVARSRHPTNGLYTWHSKPLTHLWVGQVRVERSSQSNLYSVTSVDGVSAGAKRMDFGMRGCDRTNVILDGCYTLLALHQETYGQGDIRFLICKVLLEDEIPISRNFEPLTDHIFGTIIHMQKMEVLRTASDEDTRGGSSLGQSLRRAWERNENWKQKQMEADGSWQFPTVADQLHSVKYYIYL